MLLRAWSAHADKLWSSGTGGNEGMSPSNDLYRKWTDWLDRIENDQLLNLVINRHIFTQVREVAAPYVGQQQGAELLHWMVQNYIAFASTAIRRMIEAPNRKWRSISLVILLEDLA